MNTLAQFLVVAAVAATITAAHAQESRLVLRQVEERLRPIFVDLTPAPAVEYPEYSQSLLVYYRPQKFLVHGRSKTGEWSTNVFEEIGPSFTGFVLRVHLEKLGDVNQAVTPQTIQEPYWRTFLDVTPIAGTTNQIYWVMSSGGGTDEKLLMRVRQALGSLAGRGQKTGAEPDGAANRNQPIRLETNSTPSKAGSDR
jgi:hypothetical protein